MNNVIRNNNNVTSVTLSSIKASEWTPAHSLAMAGGQTMPMDTASVNRRVLTEAAPIARTVRGKTAETFTVPEGFKLVVMSGKPLSIDTEGCWQRIRMV